MRALRTLTGSFTLAALTACTTVGPNYKLPAAAVANAPAAQGAFLGANNPAVSQAPVPDDWWRLYDDPILNHLVETALAANTDVRVAAANLARVQAVVIETRSQGDVQGGVSASLARAQLSGESYLVPARPPVSNLADLSAGISYDLDLFGQLRRATEAASADAEASKAGLDLVRVNVAAEVAGAYLDVCSSNEELAVAEQTIALQEKHLAVTQRLVAAGRGAEFDLPRARALLAQARSAAPLHRAHSQAALFRLAALVGKPPAEFPKEAAACAELPKLRQPIPVGDGGAALLARRPDVRQAERQLASATARIGVAVAALYPNVSIGISAGTAGLLGDIGGASTNKWSMGSLVSWTFPTSGTRARIRGAGATADGSLAHFDGVVLNALRETETNLSTYAQDLDRNADLREARDQALMAQSQTERLYRAGNRPFLDALDSERTLAQAEAALAASNGQLAADQVKLFLSLGGGWRQAPPPNVVAATDRSPSMP